MSALDPQFILYGGKGSGRKLDEYRDLKSLKNGSIYKVGWIIPIFRFVKVRINCY